MIYALNYADEKYKKAQILNTWSLYHLGRVDKVYEYVPKDIDHNFFQKNKGILTSETGGGYWLWKPYFIYETLKKINQGEYLLYLDSGAVILHNCKELIRIMDDLNQDILCFSTPFLEKTYCKQSVLSQYNNNEYSSTFQIEATYIFMRKTQEIMDFVEDWLISCCVNENIIDDAQYFFPCVAHRHDQSIFSLTCKEYKYTPYINLSDRYLICKLLKFYDNGFKPDSPYERTIQYLTKFKNCNFKLFFIVHHIGNSKHFFISVLKRSIQAYLCFFKSKKIYKSMNDQIV